MIKNKNKKSSRNRKQQRGFLHLPLLFSISLLLLGGGLVIQRITSPVQVSVDEIVINNPTTTDENIDTKPKDDPDDKAKDEPTKKNSEIAEQPPKNECSSVDESIGKINTAIGTSHGIDVSADNETFSATTLKPITKEDACELETFASMFISTFRKIPSGVSKKANMDILLVKYIKYNGYVLAATPRADSNVVVYDIDGNGGGVDYIKQVLYHEYWHAVDYYLTGSYYYQDSSWSACNSTSFSYGGGGYDAYEGGFTNEFHPSSGFITAYATYGMEEDRAELFSWMLYDEQRVKTAAKNDTRLSCKIALLEDKIQSLEPSYDW